MDLQRRRKLLNGNVHIAAKGWGPPSTLAGAEPDYDVQQNGKVKKVAFQPLVFGVKIVRACPAFWLIGPRKFPRH